MSRPSTRIVVALLTLLVVHLGLTSDAVRAASDKIAAAEESWRWVSNPRFEILTNGPERRARALIDELESFRAAIGVMVGGQVDDPPKPIRVLLFDRVWDFSPYQMLDAKGKPETFAGYFLGRGDTNYFALSNEQGDFVPRIVLHEYSHLLVAKQLGRLPTWLNEGLAEYLSAFRYIERERRAEIGRAIPEHMQYLNSSTHAPLQQIVGMTYESPEFAREVPRTLFYAKSWLLVHYLQVGSVERTGALARFTQFRAQGLDDVQALEKAVGCTLAELDQELSIYQRKSLVSFKSFPLPENPRGKEISARASTAADALFRLGEYLQALGPERQGEALAHFAAAGRTAPIVMAQATVRTTFEPLPERSGPPADARTLAELRDAVARGDAPAATKELYARQVQETASRDWEAAQNDVVPARRALREIILESPRDERRWLLLNWLYTAEMEPADREAGIEVYLRGVELAPELEIIARGLTNLFAAAGEYARARAALDAAMARAGDTQGDRFDTLLIELDAWEAKRLADAGDPQAGVRLLEARVAASSPTWRPGAEAALARFRGRIEGDRIEAQYQAAVALVNAQKIDAGGDALRVFLVQHPDSIYAEQAKADLVQVDDYLARRRARTALNPPPPPPAPPPS